MGGSTKKTQNSASTQTGSSTTGPWAPAVPAVTGLLGRIGDQFASTPPINGYESGALDQLRQNALAGNPYAGRIGNLADNLFSGGPDRSGMAQGNLDAYRNAVQPLAGSAQSNLQNFQAALQPLASGGPDRTGTVTDAYGQLKSSLLPYASGAMMGQNSGLNPYLDTLRNQIETDTNGMFAAAGRDLSGANQKALGLGVTQGLAPIIAQQFNTDTTNRLAAINSLFGGGLNAASTAGNLDQQRFNNQLNVANAGYNAGNTTSGALSDIASSLYGAGNNTLGILSAQDQQRLANQQAAIGAAQSALQARDAGANQLLSVESQARALPQQQLAQQEGLTLPLAQLGGTQSSNSSGTQTGFSTEKTPISKQIVDDLGTLGGKGSALGSSGWLFSTPAQTGATGLAAGGGLLNSFLGGLGSILPSDERVKQDIAPVGKLSDGQTVYSYRYRGEPATRIGLLAHEVQRRRPDAVVNVGGLKAVDYKKATQRARGILGGRFG